VKEMKMTEEENTFQKIAEDLHLTVGQVQSYWENWMGQKEDSLVNLNQNQTNLPDEVSSQANSQISNIPQMQGKMQAKLISPRKAIFFWDASDLPKQFFQYYFNIHFDDLVPVIHIYDVTEIQFNGKNAHHFYEIPISYQQGYWVVKGLFSNRSYLAEVGVKLSNGSFFPLIRSNSIRIPKLETVLDNEQYQDISQLYRDEEQTPKWREFVSTYSYYLDNGSDGGKK
jgi:uncharacterized protein